MAKDFRNLCRSVASLGDNGVALEGFKPRCDSLSKDIFHKGHLGPNVEVVWDTID